MVTKLNQIVKRNSTEHLFVNAGILPNQIEAAINEASGAMVDVLKNQLESGKALDLISFFKGIKSNRILITNLMVKKYTNRLNKYYQISDDAARDLATAIIPASIEQFIGQTDDEPKTENGFILLLNWLSGNTVNFESFFLRSKQVQVA
jgi:hypothetical protein